MEDQEIYEKIQPLVQKEISVAIEKDNRADQFKVAKIPYHTHTGTDAPRVPFKNLANRSLYLFPNLYGADPATAANYGVFFIAPWKCYLQSVQVAFQVASTSGTLQLERLTGTEALDAGQNMLNTTISLAGTADTVTSGVLPTDIADRQIAKGDRLALVDAGTLTNLVGLSIIIELIFN